MAKDTWFTADLPVLDAVVTFLEVNDPSLRPQLYDIAELTGLDEADVIRAAKRLDGVYIEIQHTMAPDRDLVVTGVSAEARVATGQWPSAEGLAERIINGLEEAASLETDVAKQGRLREAASALGSTAKDVGTSVLAAVIAKQLGA